MDDYIKFVVKNAKGVNGVVKHYIDPNCIASCTVRGTGDPITEANLASITIELTNGKRLEYTRDDGVVEAFKELQRLPQFKE